MIHWAWLIPTFIIGGWLGAAIACGRAGALATTVEACKDVCPVAAALREENARLRAVAEKARKVTGNVIRCVVAMDDEPGLKERWRCVKEDDLRQLWEALAALEEV